MRTLIVDNYDSFTYNLVHQLAGVTGVPPAVVRNDDPDWTPDRLPEFDAVVISPGPGRPDRPLDFGICADIVRTGELPLLGVCLGHQGICSVLGGTVDAAPEPVHGRRSPVLHTGVDVLAGLPSPFEAVRYHSLAVGDVPAELEAIGWTPDGVLMAVRHRSRPMWGVQFHPESIRTEHGDRLVAGFVDLARRWHAQRPRPRLRASTPTRTAEERAPEHPLRLQVAHRRLRLDVSAEVVFAGLYRDAEHAFWLDSSRPDGDRGRFSFLGDASGPLARVVTADVRRDQVPFLDWLDGDLRARRVAPSGLPFDLVPGWVGYLGYELKAQCGASTAHASPYPDAAMLFADRVVAVDHADGSVWLAAAHPEGDDGDAEEWLEETADALAALAIEPLVPPSRDVGADLGPLGLRVGRDRYLSLVEECRTAIAAGETYEVCLTNQLSAEGVLDPYDAYRVLRQDNPVPFGALLRMGPVSVLSCSPERFLRVGADRSVESRPIKGTRPRGSTAAEDARLRADLRHSVKDQAENLMIVDLVRHDLGRTAELGSVHVPELFEVESYPTVHQLVSTVRARLAPGRTAVDCVRAAFPGGSMTGAPKIRTMAIIDELERAPRGIYSGAIGWLSVSGAADLSIAIRTLVVEPGRVSYGTGGAVVALSDPADEYAETMVKAAPLLRLLGRAAPAHPPARDVSAQQAGVS